MLLTSIKNSLDELKELLMQLSISEYTMKCNALSNSTIGEHSRHIIEMFQCLQKEYDLGIVNYDSRQRNQLIQSDSAFAIEQIERIQENLDKKDKRMTLRQIIDGEELLIETNYFRELLYNFEHCIHHQALIKVGVINHCTISLSDNFGVARSTIEYRKQCVQ